MSRGTEGDNGHSVHNLEGNVGQQQYGKSTPDFHCGTCTEKKKVQLSILGQGS